MAPTFFGAAPDDGGVLAPRKDSMEMSERRSPQETGTSLPSSLSTLTNPWEPSRCGTLGPCKSTSRMPTLKPCAASVAARFTVTELLPTPPLPLMTKSLCRTSFRFSDMTLRCMAAVMGIVVCPCCSEHDAICISPDGFEG